MILIDGQKISEQKSMDGAALLIDPSRIEGLGFAGKGVEVLARGARLRVSFRVGGDGEAEGVAGFGADEFDEFAGVTEFAGFGHIEDRKSVV